MLEWLQGLDSARNDILQWKTWSMAGSFHKWACSADITAELHASIKRIGKPIRDAGWIVQYFAAIVRGGSYLHSWIPPENLSAILFDKDGTLVDYDKTWLLLNRRAAQIAARGDLILEHDLLAGCGTDPVSGRTVADSLFAAGNAKEIARHMISLGSRFDLLDLTKRLDALYDEGAHNAVAITDLPPVFARLRDIGFQIGIASSDNEAAIHTTTAVLGIHHQVDFVAGYDSGHGSKPEPGMVHGFCAHIGSEPARILVVGDSRHDMEMGRSAGAGGTIGVLSGTGSRETLGRDADFLVESVAELPGLLTRRF
jgi:phosphoglycolate phosphatase